MHAGLLKTTSFGTHDVQFVHICPRHCNLINTSQVRGRASVEASSRDLPHQLGSSAIGMLNEASPRASRQCSAQPSKRVNEGEHAEAAVTAEDEVLSPSFSTHAQLPADVSSGRVESASDANTSRPECLHQLPEQLRSLHQSAPAAVHMAEGQGSMQGPSRPFGRQTAGLDTAARLPRQLHPGYPTEPCQGAPEVHATGAQAQEEVKQGVAQRADTATRQPRSRRRQRLDTGGVVSNATATTSSSLQATTGALHDTSEQTARTEQAPSPLARPLQPTQPSVATHDAADSMCNQQEMSNTARQLQHQHSRHTAQSSVDALRAESSQQGSLQAQLNLAQFLGNTGPAWGPPEAVPGIQQGAHAPAVQSAEAGSQGQAEDQLQHSRGHSAEAMDSFVGAIMLGASDDDADGEVVDESDMYQQCYYGHCNLSQSKEVHSYFHAVTVHITKLW